MYNGHHYRYLNKKSNGNHERSVDVTIGDLNIATEIVLMIAIYLDLKDLVRFGNTCFGIRLITSSENSLWENLCKQNSINVDKPRYSWLPQPFRSAPSVEYRKLALTFLEEKHKEHLLKANHDEIVQKEANKQTIVFYSIFLNQIIENSTTIRIKVWKDVGQTESSSNKQDLYQLFKKSYINKNSRKSLNDPFNPTFNEKINIAKYKKDISLQMVFDTFISKNSKIDLTNIDISIVFENDLDIAASLPAQIADKDKYKLIFFVVSKDFFRSFQDYFKDNPQIKLIGYNTVSLDTNKLIEIKHHIFNSVVIELNLMEKYIQANQNRRFQLK